MTRAHSPSTPLSTSKSAALSRVLDLIGRGYTRYTAGQIPEQKLMGFLQKFHERYGIGCSPAQRITRKQKGVANAALVLYRTPLGAASGGPGCTKPDAALDSSPASNLASDSDSDFDSNSASVTVADSTTMPANGEQPIQWLLLVTSGGGPVTEMESLNTVMEKPGLTWLGYELVRYANRGRISWTWRRPKGEMEDWYALLGVQLAARKMSAVLQTLLLISRQPGFSGVREQSWALMQFARSRGYAGELPFLFHMQKVAHGAPLRIPVP